MSTLTEAYAHPELVARAKPDTDPSVSAIVVSYRSRETIAGCLAPLVELGAEVWVVDNASDDGSAELVRERFPTVNLIANRVNEGFGSACNRALARARGSVILLVNPDCVIEPASASRLVAHLRAHPEAGIVGPRIEGVDGTPSASAHAFETPASTLFLLAGGRALLSPAAKRWVTARLPGQRSYRANFAADAEAGRVDWLSGACLAVRADLLRGLDGFDEGYFLFMEDEDLCRRAAATGALVELVPDALARHQGGASSGEIEMTYPAFYRSLLRFQARSHPRAYPLIRAALGLRSVFSLSIALARSLAGLKVGRRAVLAWARVLRMACVTGRREAARPARGALG